MVDIRAIREGLDDIRTVNIMSGVMRDIAATRTQELRDQFRQNMLFYSEVRDLYGVIRGLVRRREDAVPPPKASWGIVVTSNNRFYGGLNRQVVEYFLDNFDKYDDHLVIGNTGGQYIGKTNYFQKCSYLSFDEDLPSTEEMRKLTEQMKEYDRVDIYYPAYKNPFHQEPTSFDINAAPDKTEEGDGISESFITEPDLEKLHDFFSTHVKWVLFQRVILETDLARTSARLMKMHSAEEASEDAMEEISNNIRRERREQSNIQLLESIIALKQWQKMHENK